MTGGVLQDLATPLAEFCHRQRRHPLTVRLIAGDASGRQYYRLAYADGSPEILMDSQREMAAVEPFIRTAALLRSACLSAPEIYCADADEGLLLLEDLGEVSLAAAAAAAPAQTTVLYDRAADVLIRLGAISIEDKRLPRFDAARFREQAGLFLEMLPRLGYRGVIDADGFAAALDTGLAAGFAVPNRLLLRDYHADNILWRSGKTGLAGIGLIDFQDAGIGPVTYDLISLTEDARRDLPDGLQRRVIARYLAAYPELAGPNFDNSLKVMAAMRHLRVLAIFARLAEWGKPDYLRHLPRVWRHLQETLDAPCLGPLQVWLARHPVDLEMAEIGD